VPAVASSSIRLAARALSGALEPVIGQVYFSPECHASYVALGFAPSAREMNGVALPDGPAYFTSRGSLLGKASGHLVASAFAVFNPVAVVASVNHGWSLTDAATIRAARHDGAVGQLRRLIGDDLGGLAAVNEALARGVDVCRPEGRPLFAGVISEPVPIEPLDRLFVLGDALREFRGDAHTAAWTSAGLDAVEIGLLTECYWGLPFKSYVRSRAWSEAELDAGLARLQNAGFVDDTATSMTEAGRAFRERIEDVTDDQLTPAINAMGDTLDPAVATLSRWAATVRGGFGYPASGPQDLARLASPR
jgi:hypothetical protein